ncbi:hypothetical protein CRH09_22395 [Nocardia terpenica]|uniref:Uncharacterized protein n=1 Tax=Nocardia terpenica TaxID=455432 RepID=A0A291RMK9_9NOCA|nr:hypothetical protein CRH09_22395 [Nocardia terpenica]
MPSTLLVRSPPGLGTAIGRLARLRMSPCRVGGLAIGITRRVTSPAAEWTPRAPGRTGIRRLV